MEKPTPTSIISATEERIYAVYSHNGRRAFLHCIATGLTEKEARFMVKRLDGYEEFVRAKRQEFSKLANDKYRTNQADKYLYQKVHAECDRLADRMIKLPYFIRQRTKIRPEYSRIHYRVRTMHDLEPA